MIQKEIEIFGKKIVIQSGDIAKKSNGSVVVRIGDTSVLVTVVMKSEKMPPEKQGDFVPLTVDYRERTYATGRIPGGFFKREGRPAEREILTSRVIDRMVRPLIPGNICREVQINILVLSSDGQNDTEVISAIGGSTALMISDVPYNGPVSCVMVGRIGEEFVVNPTYEQAQSSTMELAVTGTQEKIMMLEMGAKEVDEKMVLEAIEFVKPVLGKLCALQEEFAKEAGKKKIVLEDNVFDKGIDEAVKKLVSASISEFMKEDDTKVYGPGIEKLKTEFTQIEGCGNQIKYLFEKYLREEVRSYILSNKKRVNGRLPEELRDISCKTGYLPRLHGSALFTRGQTQALATITLGTPHDMQIIEELEGEFKERFMFHYNFPGFATGDVKPDRSPSRREIGHGALAKKALYPLLPNETDFPYTIRIVSDILESNGSSSMASACGGSLALFDAGVPMKAAVAGVAMGLVKEKDNYLILTDIMGMEDHLGDMDFKVAGTRNGITALQLDLKIEGITTALISEILSAAKKARMNILDIMDKEIEKPRPSLADSAPRMVILQIPQSKIGGLIGPGGKNIRQIIEESGAQIDIEEDGRVFISSCDSQSLELAKKMVEACTAEVEVGKIYKGKVVKIMDFGAFVEILPGKDGLVHISQLAERRVNKVTDVVKEGDEVVVKVLEIDSQGKVSLSRKAVLKSNEK